jgi:ABC-type sugar transport system ATPase subunit
MIEVRDVHKELGEFSLRGATLRIESGEYFVVLGPTGAGKTVLLECIAGLHKVDRGQVWLEGREVTGFLPEDRNVGYVPQDYVLFPHISLRDNIEFSLVLKGAPRAHIDGRVKLLSEMLGIRHLLDRPPRTLSGGEQQRGALARALAPEPTVLLLDEPLSALDEGTRGELIQELDHISRVIGTTVIHVCHNFEEALELADRIAVMDKGNVVQVGKPAEVFRRPLNGFVARFVGAQNLFPVASVDPAGDEITLEGGVRLRVACTAEGAKLMASVRPEEIAVRRAADEDGAGPRAGENTIACTLKRIDDRGRYARLSLEGDLPLVVALTQQAFAATGAAEGDRLLAAFPPQAVHLLPA